MRFLVTIVLSLAMFTCSESPQNLARDTAAALGGAISLAVTQNQATCTVTPTASTCTLIVKAAAAQNALITAEETYCGWAVSAPPPVTATCTPVSSASAALTAAIANATPFIAELKAVIQ